MRIPLSIAALVFLTTYAPIRLYEPPTPPRVPTIRFEPVPLAKDTPGLRQAGRLRYLGGYALRSNDSRFGGISSMEVSGGTVTALTDSGILIRFSLPGSGGPPPRLRPLPSGPSGDDPKSDRDAEAMVVHGGRAWVTFESRNQVWRYRLPDFDGEASSAPPAMEDWPGNVGGEAMVRLADGRFLVFAEGPMRGDGTSQVVLFDRDPTRKGARAARLRYRPPPGYRITDARALADGRLLFLNRRFAFADGFTTIVTLAAPGPVRAGMTLSGEEIAALRPPLTSDNMEALSVEREAGRTIVWIASDDNYNSVQRTLLMKFELG